MGDGSLDWRLHSIPVGCLHAQFPRGGGVLGVGGFFGAKLYVQNKAAEDLDALLTQARPFVDIEYEQVVATIRGELRVEDVTIRLPQFDDALTVESVGVLTPGFLFLLGFDRQELEFPEYLGLALTGLRAERRCRFHAHARRAARDASCRDRADAGGSLRGHYGTTPAALKRLGYHEVVMDLHASLRTEATRFVVVLGAQIEQMYELDVEFTLDGADPTAMARGATAVFRRGAARLRRSVAERAASCATARSSRLRAKT